MYRICRVIHFCYAHRLINYSGKCRHLHGHNGLVQIIVQSNQLDSVGMVVDIARIKEVVEEWVDETLDHTLILCRDDPFLPVLQKHGEKVFVMEQNPTSENIARLIFDHAKNAGLPVIEVILWETTKHYASYSESGGSFSTIGC